MPDDARVFRYLASLPGLQAPRIEWVDHLQNWPHYKSFQDRFLKSTGRLADSIACEINCLAGCSRNVFRRSRNTVIANCSHSSANPRKISAEDAVILKLDMNGFFDEIRAAFSIEKGEGNISGKPMTWYLGDYVPIEGKRFPIYFTHQIESEELIEVLQYLCVTLNDRFSMLCFLRKPVCTESESLLKQYRSLFLALEDEVEFNEKAALKTMREIPEIFSSFHAEVRQAVRPDKTMRFPTPKGSKWSDVKIRFVDGHTVSITVGAKKQQASYAEMGMEDSRRKMPNKQWELLRNLADGYGQLSWRDSSADWRNSKQKELLSKILCSVFGITGDPISWDPNERCYQCAFTLIPDAD